MRKLLMALMATPIIMLAACNGLPSQSVSVGPTGTPAVTVPNAISGLAKLSDADLKQAMSDLEATNGGKPPTAIPFVDDYTCVSWMDTQLPQWVQIANGLIPSANAKGPVSAFIELKIATTNAQGIVSNVTSAAPAQFAHYCGAAVQNDVGTVTAILNKVGIKVAAGVGTGGVAGLLGGLIP